MHGRLKTRTTEEQEKIKKLERQKKVEAYKKSMGLLVDMRKSGNYEQTALDIGSAILMKNPDILTVWNYRREIFLRLKNEVDKDEFQKTLEGEMVLTERCLQVNPKSYGSWHHRVWVMSIMPEPNWDRELKLCKRYLELDERNFHCWDYRRFVARMGNVTDSNEYEYTLDKIKANFSNYSAWHLRSKLLPKIFPDEKCVLPINETKHKEELQLVENAAFTDPNDQSAWFYQRWLLGLSEPKIHVIYSHAEGNQILVATSKGLNQCSNTQCGTFIRVEINGEIVKGVWKSFSEKQCSSVWTLLIDFEVQESDKITLYTQENGVENEKIHVEGLKYQIKEPNFLPTFSPSVKEVLEQELLNCEQLLELEPESKWTNLTKSFLMQAIDVSHYQKDIKSTLENLIEIDPLRSGYYRDFLSKYIIENEIRNFYTKNDCSQQCRIKFVLTGCNITCLYHMQYLLPVEDVDLSDNSLTSEALASLGCLLNCKRLNLDNNKIDTLKFMPPLPKLEYLSLCNNLLKEKNSEDLLKFSKLKEINF